MSEQQWQVGDVVELKSGGPRMTVESIGTQIDPDGVVCRWFEGKDLKQATFPPGSLQKPTPPPVPRRAR